MRTTNTGYISLTLKKENHMATRRGLRTILLLSWVFFISIPLFIVGYTGAGTGGGFDPAAGLIHYYPFTGNAQDFGEDPKYGTPDGALLTTDRHGSADSAYSFDGSSVITLDYFPVPDPVTVSAWIKTSQTPSNILLWRELPSEIGSDREGLTITDGNIEYVVSNGAMLGAVTGDADISTGAWVHVAAVKSANTITLYVNGPYETEGTMSMALTLNNLTIGYLFTGSIDEVRVYSRALSQNEIQALAGI
jgi:hypothetical protein